MTSIEHTPPTAPSNLEDQWKIVPHYVFLSDFWKYYIIMLSVKEKEQA